MAGSVGDGSVRQCSIADRFVMTGISEFDIKFDINREVL